MAKIDIRLSCDNATRTYSDGSIEQEIFEVLSNGKEVDWYSDKRWPVISYFSPMRSNIINWYPFKEDATVLEVGAGCGALTGYLCNRVAHVTSVEKSIIRSQINLKRHDNCDNLDIIVDDFSTMELSQKYDYVVIVGVLEYSAWTFPGDNPADAFLRKASSFLKKDGKMLIAIENRLGIKYLSGAREDHVGRFFAGINNYVGESVHTFSRSELTDKIAEAGLHVSRFFYPYPDYKFPEEIFTDASINERYPLSADYGMDATRVSIFSMMSLYQGVMREKCAESFANSFLVEVTANSQVTPTPYKYVKISNNRKPEYAICTVITDDNRVMKQAIYSCGEEHIDRMASLGGYEYSHCIRNIPCVLDKKNQASFPFVEGNSLLTRIKSADLQARKDVVMHWFAWLKTELFSKSEVYTINENSADFKLVFGSDICSDALHWMPYGNIDILSSNIIGDMDNATVIDYEWQMKFPIPAEYTLWRFLTNLIVDEHLLNLEYTADDKMAALLSCSEETVHTFKKWEFHFANEYVEAKGMTALSQPVYTLDFDDAIKAIREVADARKKINTLNKEIESLKKQNMSLNNEIESISKTRTWQIRTKLLKFVGR